MVCFRPTGLTNDMSYHIGLPGFTWATRNFYGYYSMYVMLCSLDTELLSLREVPPLRDTWASNYLKRKPYELEIT